MDKEEEERQIREARNLLQKAKQRNASLETKREALRRLTSLAHSESSRELKIFAAQNFSHHFKEFPEMEKSVIDSVYDICEDPDSQVRIEGYKAIVALSSESKKWTRRNTDVLVQLLQSDEPLELKQIQDSLIAHVKLDPPAAIGVLCDHCSLETELTEEEMEDRGRLRKLVLLFLSAEAKEAVFAHFHGPNSEAEEVFRNGLIKAISGADIQDTEIIVKDLLMPLESFASRTENGDALLSVLLDKAKVTFNKLKSQPGSISLAPVKPYLSLLEYVAVHKKVANPAPLLRFYSMTLIGKMALQKLDQPSQIDIVQRLADILAVCEEQRQKEVQTQSSQELTMLRNMVVDACPHLLEKLVKTQNHDRRNWQACVTLLKACRQRHEDFNWTPPTNLSPTLNVLNSLADQTPPPLKDLSTQTKQLIKVLQVLEPRSPVIPLPERSASLKRKFEADKPVSTPPRSPLSRPGGGASAGPTTQSVNRSQSDLRTRQSDPSQHPAKLINRIGGDVSVGEPATMLSDTTSTIPTLLRRMSYNNSTASAAPSSNNAVGRNGRATSQMNSPQGPPVATQIRAPTPPASSSSNGQNFSIKGAASKLSGQSAKEESKVESKPKETPGLLDRMGLTDGNNGMGDMRGSTRHGNTKKRRRGNNRSG